MWRDCGRMNVGHRGSWVLVPQGAASRLASPLRLPLAWLRRVEMVVVVSRGSGAGRKSRLVAMSPDCLST